MIFSIASPRRRGTFRKDKPKQRTTATNSNVARSHHQRRGVSIWSTALVFDFQRRSSTTSRSKKAWTLIERDQRWSSATSGLEKEWTLLERDKQEGRLARKNTSKLQFIERPTTLGHGTMYIVVSQLAIRYMILVVDQLRHIL